MFVRRKIQQVVDCGEVTTAEENYVVSLCYVKIKTIDFYFIICSYLSLHWQLVSSHNQKCKRNIGIENIYGTLSKIKLDDQNCTFDTQILT